MGLSRRHLVVSLGTAFLIPQSGCLSGDSATETDQESPLSSSPTATRVPISVSNGSLVVNRTITDEYTEYLQDRDSVRYVQRWKHTNHENVENGSQPEREPVYGVRPFDEWGRIQCSSTAIDGVWTAIQERTTTSLDGIHVGSKTSGEPIQITVARTTTLDRDGDVKDEPEISHERLDAITPDDAAITITFENRSYSCQPSVSVTNTTAQED